MEIRKDKQVRSMTARKRHRKMTVSAFVLQNPGTIAGMIQKVKPFTSSQAEAADTQGVHSEFSSSSGSLADDGNQPEKQVDPCSETTTATPQPLALF